MNNSILLQLIWRIPVIVLLFMHNLNANAQGDAINDVKLDVSKPTNFYTYLDNNLEYTSTEDANVFGYRANFTFSLSSSHLLLAEVPLLHNDNTNKTGIGDIRVRYFWLPYKNYEKLFGAFGPSLDIIAPTGNFEKGLGTGRWVVSPGITAGLMVSERIQFFPVLSYQYLSKSTSDLIPDELDNDQHGMTFQVITPVVFSDRLFSQITPIVAFNNLSDNKSAQYNQEFLLSYAIKETLWSSVFYRGAFKDDMHTVRLGLTIYL